MALPTPTEGTNGLDSLKRKYRETLEAHAQQISTLQETQQQMLAEVSRCTRA